MGSEVIGESAALRIWSDLLHNPFLTSITLVRAAEGAQIVGFAAACIVSAQFIDAELANPRAGTNARFIESCAAGRPLILNRAEVARANAGQGVDILQLYGSVRSDLSLEEQFQAIVPMSSKFIEYYRGYRVRTVLSEMTSEFEQRFSRGSGSRIFEFPGTNRGMVYATRETMAAMPSSVGATLFNYAEPVLRLRPSDQELLLAALNGATDEEIAPMLCLTQDAIKARWRSALARIAEAKPDLVEGLRQNERRGAQKRHRILSYVREHVEELRSYDWGADR